MQRLDPRGMAGVKRWDRSSGRRRKTFHRAGDASSLPPRGSRSAARWSQLEQIVPTGGDDVVGVEHVFQPRDHVPIWVL